MIPYTPPEENTPDLTPVECRSGVFFKRDDLFSIAGGRGAKVRSCWLLAQNATGLVTCGSRASPQVNIVANVAKKLGIPCRAHTPTGELFTELLLAKMAGAVITQHPMGFTNVINARAREDAKQKNWRWIPFGMECEEAVASTAHQVENIPRGVKRIVVTLGSGMSLAGIIRGLRERKLKIPVLGVNVGGFSEKRIDRFVGPQPRSLLSAGRPDWRDIVTVVDSVLPYKTHSPDVNFRGVDLDPIYEAKCVPYIKKGDLFWVIGISASVLYEKQIQSRR